MIIQTLLEQLVYYADKDMDYHLIIKNASVTNWTKELEELLTVTNMLHKIPNQVIQSLIVLYVTKETQSIMLRKNKLHLKIVMPL